jgi:4-diphosphocytidyl-2C-methyl-D-erythritol kinase
MGLGGGSGNAGAVLDFIGAKLPLSVISKIGADVPFFYTNCETAIVHGIGEKIVPVQKLQLSVAIIIPRWNSITGNAYKLLDMYWNSKGGYPFNEGRAKEELERVYSLLASNKHVGLLPNDFAPRLIEENELYNRFFKIFSDIGAVAWGITGSGASIFVLHSDDKFSSLLLDKVQAYNKSIHRIILS